MEVTVCRPERVIHDPAITDETGALQFRAIGGGKWCGWRGSNPRPLASEANTLSTELQPHFSILNYLTAASSLVRFARSVKGETL
jgi:hypothetical protein